MIEIKSKKDIIIPFKSMQDIDWEIKTKEILKNIAQEWGNELAKPISSNEIVKLENRIGIELPENLKLFYQKFGIADIGEELQDFNSINWLKDLWKEQPEYAPNFTIEDKQYLPYLITFSNYLGNGNMFCFHSKTKHIYYYDHDGEPYISKIFNSIDEYIKGCLISCQTMFYSDNVDENKVEEWCNEILIELYDEKIIKKWKY